MGPSPAMVATALYRRHGYGRCVHELALEARGLTKRFGKVVALDGLDLLVSPGESVAILGDAAAGKSTALRCFAGLVRPSSGTITLGGVDPRSRAGLAARARIGYLGQEPGFYDWMTGRELLAYAVDLLGAERSGASERVQGMVDLVGLAPVADRRIAEYALAQRARLGLGQALVGEPELLLLDEPLAGLDPAGRSEILELLAELRVGASIVVATADVSLAETAAARIVVLDQGRAVAAEPTPGLLDRVASEEYVLETDAGPGLALAGLAARLEREAWVSNVSTTDGALRISVSDEGRADHELLPAIAATGMTVQALRRERPAVGTVVDRIREDAA